jgi:tRNA A58 N-methylase Trm61
MSENESDNEKIGRRLSAEEYRARLARRSSVLLPIDSAEIVREERERRGSRVMP